MVQTSGALVGISLIYAWNKSLHGKKDFPLKSDTSSGSVFLIYLFRWKFPSTVNCFWWRCLPRLRVKQNRHHLLGTGTDLKKSGVFSHPCSIFMPGSMQHGQWTIKFPGTRFLSMLSIPWPCPSRFVAISFRQIRMTSRNWDDGSYNKYEQINPLHNEFLNSLGHPGQMYYL
jgi:hypothetical protein